MKAVWLFLLALVLALAGALGIRYGIDRALAARDAQAQLGSAVADLFSCEGGLLPLHWSGRTISSRGFIAQSAQGAFEICASDVKIPLGLAALLRREYKIDNVRAAHLQMAFGSFAISRLERGETPALVSPQQSALRELNCPAADLSWGETADALGEIRGAAAHVYPQFGVVVNGGVIRLTNLPAAQVQQMKLRFDGTALRAEEASLTFGGASAITATGTLHPPLDVDLTFTHCPIAQMLEGECNGRAHAQRRPNESLRANGTIDVVHAIVRDVASLQRVAQLTGRADLAPLKIDNAHADFDFDGATIVVKNFVLDAKPLLTIRGEFSVRGERVDGEFELGVAPDVAEKFPGAREDIFQRNADGYVWTQVAISGKRDNLHDNLRPRLVRAARDHHADEKVIDALEEL